MTWVAVDGGMSDNPRPQLYDARYTALAREARRPSRDRRVSLAGLHCESGDVLIDDVALAPEVRRGDLLAVPATGAYTLSMASNYNGVPRPAAVLVGGRGTLIRRRETVDDLLALERELTWTPASATSWPSASRG